jgi:NAD(P)-dependent dehydrogenase (short-subunit alcohol dehydrogenase family)
MPTALITGASRGLGRALADGLAQQGWNLVIDGRDPEALEDARQALAARGTPVTAVAGDVTDPRHRRALRDAAGRAGGLDLVVNNASTLGASPLPPLLDYPLDVLREVLEVDVVAPLALIQECWLLLRRSERPRIINISSDAAVEPYPGWGGYGQAKAALEQQSLVLAEENPTALVWVVDPGDLRTRLHQEAFPGEDISDRPDPESVVPAFLALVGSEHPSGRVRAAELAADLVAVTGGRP